MPTPFGNLLTDRDRPTRWRRARTLFFNNRCGNGNALRHQMAPIIRMSCCCGIDIIADFLLVSRCAEIHICPVRSLIFSCGFKAGDGWVGHLIVAKPSQLAQAEVHVIQMSRSRGFAACRHKPWYREDFKVYGFFKNERPELLIYTERQSF